MHDTAFEIGHLVMRTYLPARTTKVLEVGALNVNGTLRDAAPRTAEYTGIDFDEGPGVDIVISDPESWPLADDHYDLVMASSVFEHDSAFWQTFLAMVRKTKQGGHIYVSAPSNGTVHRYPKDCWRFYPDSGLALEDWARRNDLDVVLIESFVATRKSEVYNDFCAIFRRGPTDLELNSDFVHDHVGSENVLTWQSKDILKPTADPEDVRLIEQSQHEFQRLTAHCGWLSAQFSEKESTLLNEQVRLETLATSHETRVAQLAGEVEHRSAALAAQEIALKSVAEERDQLHAKIGLLETESQERATQTGALSDQSTNLSHDLAAQIALNREMQDKLGALQSEVNQRREEADQAWAEARDASALRDRVAGDLEAIRIKLDDSTSWVARLALGRTNAEREIASSHRKLAALAIQVTQHGRARDLAQDEAKHFKRQLADAVERLNTMHAQAQASLMAAANDRKNEEMGVASKAQEIVSLENVLAERDNEIWRLQHEVATLQRQAITNDFHPKISETNSRDADELARLKSEISDLSAMRFVIPELTAKLTWVRKICRLLLASEEAPSRFLPRKWQRAERQKRLLENGLFDTEVYYSLNPDVASSGRDALTHYVVHGIDENRRITLD